MIRVFVNELPTNVTLLRSRVEQLRKIDYLCKDFTPWIEDYDDKGYGKNATTVGEYFENLEAYLVTNPNAIADVRYCKRFFM